MTHNLTPKESSPIHIELFRKLDETLKSYDDKLSRQELLAIAATIVGKLVCLQNQILSDRDLKALISMNIQAGIDIMMGGADNDNGTVQ